MPILRKLLKVSSFPCKTSYICTLHRSMRTTAPVSWLNRKLFRFGSLKTKEETYKTEDKAPANSQLIYRAPMQSYVAWSMHVSTATASLVTAAALYQYTTNQPLIETAYGPLMVYSEDIYYFALGFVAINSVLRFVISRFPQRIYKDNGKYLAVFHSQLPGGLSRHTFNQGEVEKLYFIFNPWNNATFRLGSKTTLLFEDYFKTPSEFYEMSTKKEKE